MAFATFREILEEKLNAQTEIHVERATDTQPKTVAESIETPIEMPLFRFRQSSRYAKCNTDKKATARPKNQHQEPKVTVEQLSARGRLALLALGLRDASINKTEVRRAFRRLARKCHPDVNPAEKDAYLLIQDAYDTVLDELAGLTAVDDI